MKTKKLATQVAIILTFACAVAFAAVAFFSLHTFSRAERLSAEEAAKGQVSAVVDLLELSFSSHEAHGLKRLGILKPALAMQGNGLLDTLRDRASRRPTWRVIHRHDQQAHCGPGDDTARTADCDRSCAASAAAWQHR